MDEPAGHACYRHSQITREVGSAVPAKSGTQKFRDSGPDLSHCNGLLLCMKQWPHQQIDPPSGTHEYKVTSREGLTGRWCLEEHPSLEWVGGWVSAGTSLSVKALALTLPPFLHL